MEWGSVRIGSCGYLIGTGILLSLLSFADVGAVCGDVIAGVEG